MTYGGGKPSESKRPWTLEDENGKLKNLLVEQMFLSRDTAAQYYSKLETKLRCKTSMQKVFKPSVRCEAHGVSKWKACDVLPDSPKQR